MNQSASVFAVLLTLQDGSRGRLRDFETREEAEAYAAATGGTVRLLDRPREVKREVLRPAIGTSTKVYGPTTDAEAYAFFV